LLASFNIDRLAIVPKLAQFRQPTIVMIAETSSACSNRSDYKIEKYLAVVSKVVYKPQTLDTL